MSRRSARTAQLSAGQYRSITGWALFALCAIVITGVAVRLTGSGLGCENWPTCDGYNPVPALEMHGMVEFLNRLVTGAVSVAVILAVLGAARRQPLDPALKKWSWGLVGGVVAQIIWGGVTTLSDLHPAVVGGHFLISMVLIANAATLWHKASYLVPVTNRPTNPAAKFALGLVAWGAIALLSGVMVTGTGPHAGDPGARRFGFVLTEVVRIHSVIVWVFLAGWLAFVLLLARKPHVFGFIEDQHAATHRAIYPLGVAIVCQGAVGYVQYFNGLPPLVVGLHVAGATATWILLVRVYLAASCSAPAENRIGEPST